MDSKKERTLVVVKPDGVKRGLVGEIISRFEKVGLNLIGIKMVQVNEDMAMKHYGANDEWFENIGTKVREFYEKVGYDAGEDFAKLTNKEIGKMVQSWNVDYMTAGKTVAMIWQGSDVVKIVRKIVGSTYPSDALPGTIRGDYSVDSPLNSNTEQRSVYNLVHASGKPEEAEMEIDLWFKNEEIMDS
jgi:nucleoside-diphosphate kinase